MEAVFIGVLAEKSCKYPSFSLQLRYLFQDVISGSNYPSFLKSALATMRWCIFPMELILSNSSFTTRTETGILDTSLRIPISLMIL